jgi:hypothetical protein
MKRGERGGEETGEAVGVHSRRGRRRWRRRRRRRRRQTGERFLFIYSVVCGEAGARGAHPSSALAAPLSCAHRCRLAAGPWHSLLLDAAGWLLTCGQGAAASHCDAGGIVSAPTPVTAMAGALVRSVAAEGRHSLALTWDGRVYSRGLNGEGQLATETRKTGLHRCWWRDAKECSASPQFLIAVSP